MYSNNCTYLSVVSQVKKLQHLWKNLTSKPRDPVSWTSGIPGNPISTAFLRGNRRRGNGTRWFRVFSSDVGHTVDGSTINSMFLFSNKMPIPYRKLQGNILDPHHKPLEVWKLLLSNHQKVPVFFQCPSSPYLLSSITLPKPTLVTQTKKMWIFFLG